MNITTKDRLYNIERIGKGKTEREDRLLKNWKIEYYTYKWSWRTVRNINTKDSLIDLYKKRRNQNGN